MCRDPACPLHLGQKGANPVDDPHQVYAQGAIPDGGVVLHETAQQGDPGIVDQNVERSARGVDSPGHRRNRIGVADVANLDADRTADFHSDLIEGGGIEVDKHDMGPGVGEGFRCRPADAGGRASDQRMFPGKSRSWTFA